MVTGSGIKISETRNVGPFSQVHVSGSPDAIITIGPEQSVVVETDDNLIDMLQTEVENGQLNIRMEGSYSTSIGLKVFITMPSLDGVSVTGSGDVTATGLNGDDLKARISGSGDIELNGTASSIEASVTGSGDMDLSKLVAQKASVKVTGSGDIFVCATESVDASVTGSGDITYEGYGGQEPKVNQSVTGSGDINHR